MADPTKDPATLADADAIAAVMTACERIRNFGA
jgi:hypothetical protein